MQLFSRRGICQNSAFWRTRLPVRLRLQTLEDRAVPSFGFGSAFSFGGTGDDTGSAMAVDAAGSIYVAGQFSNTVNFDPNGTNPPSNHVLTATGGGDGFVVKYLANGTFQWVTDLGPGTYVLRELAVQGSSVYVPYSRDSAYVSRLDAGTGAVSWTTNFTSSVVEGVAVNASGVLYAIGCPSGSTTTPMFVDRLDSATGNVLWNRTAGGIGGPRVAVDGAGNVYATGAYSGTQTFGSTTLTSYPDTYDVYVWKLDSSGNSVWAGTMGSANFSTASAITSDASGNVYVAGIGAGGTDYANNFNPNPGPPVSTTIPGNFIVKLVPGQTFNVELGWVKSITLSGESIKGVAVDGSGNVYTTGTYNGTPNFNPNPGPPAYLSGGHAFVWKLDSQGNYVAVAGWDPGVGFSGIGLDASRNVYVTGGFSGTVDFDPTSGVYNLTSNGAGDACVLKLTQTDGAPTISGTQVNGGAQQRSRVTDLTVTFSTQVTFTGSVASAFTLVRTGGKPVNFTGTASVVNGVTVVLLSGFTGGETQSGSLGDGRYTLTALASKISANGLALDGNGDGTPGDNYTFGDAQGLFRFFGDINGDRHVDIADFGLFSLSYLNPANYNAAFDFNGDGHIDIADFGQFAVRYFTMLP